MKGCRFLLAVALCAAFMPAVAQPPATKPAQVLRGTITSADNHSYKMVPFDVPAGTRRVTVVFSFTQQEQRTVIDLGMFDPERFRGWSGGNKKTFTISEVDATASYLPGLLPAGKWNLVLGIPNIRPGVTSEYTAEIYLSDKIDPAPRVLKPGAAWYRGDLHTHTGQSDGGCDSMSGKRVPCPEFKLLEAAAARGLDFVAVTEHNTTSGYESLLRWQDYFDKMLLVRGREITTFTGHANIYGTADWVDFRVGSSTTANQVADRVHALGGIMSVNHPGLPSGEACMGCGWTAPLSDGKLDAIEAVNGTDVETKLSGIPHWHERLQRGERVTGIGGSDDHDSGTRPGHPVGTPTTVVYAESLSEPAILSAIRAGHVFIKTRGPDGPDVYLTAEAGGTHAMMGDSVSLSSGQRAEFSVQVRNGAGGKIEIVRDGSVANLVSDAAIAGADETRKFSITSDGARHWYRVNLRTADGSLVVLTNPIYVNFPAR